FFVPLTVAAGRALVQQEPLVETTEGTEVAINCSHPDIRTGDYIHWYRQLPGHSPKFLALIVRGSRELPDKAGQLWVSPDRRWSTLWLSRPRSKDAAVYYCALGD
ncbi:TVA4 protein, partial [Onychorhynchus coronatus]|nr:TVA4 protein [Onychorhynchus coronatus]